ncbi:MAG: hypothetical protein K2Q10_06915 [Rhodospirillales bacterium]|nr:hypothetical protein [Rhodospirillales bacterium]
MEHKRQAAYRRRQKDKGLSRVSVDVPAELAQAVRDFARQCRDGMREIAGPVTADFEPTLK